MSAQALWTVIDRLLAWQKAHKGHTSKRCLEAVRGACRIVGLLLPRTNDILAISCGRALAHDPARWGWKSLGTTAKALPTDGQPALVFFDRCGKLANGRIAGHVAVYKPSTNRHVANQTYEMNPWWRARVRYVFRPRAATD